MPKSENYRFFYIFFVRVLKYTALCNIIKGIFIESEQNSYSNVTIYDFVNFVNTCLYISLRTEILNLLLFKIRLGIKY